MVDVGGNYRIILDRMAAAAARVRRDPAEIRLLGAAKSQSVEAIQAAIVAGVTLIGENYVQEETDQKNQISTPIEWNMIGHLQRNKVKAAMEIFDVIESVDNLAVARELDNEGRKRGKTARVFIEVNLGGEQSKSGIAKNEVTALLEEAAQLPHLRVEGLMTVPPFDEHLEKV